LLCSLGEAKRNARPKNYTGPTSIKLIPDMGLPLFAPMVFVQYPVHDLLPKGVARYCNQLQQNGQQEIHN